MRTKQVIIVRTDVFDLTKHIGKLAGQVAHASAGLVEKSTKHHLDQWRKDNHAKIVLQVDNLQQLTDIYQQAIKSGIPAIIITDAAHTVFDQPTVTCVGLGPYPSDQLNIITGKLRLL